MDHNTSSCHVDIYHKLHYDMESGKMLLIMSISNNQCYFLSIGVYSSVCLHTHMLVFVCSRVRFYNAFQKVPDPLPVTNLMSTRCEVNGHEICTRLKYLIHSALR